MTRDQQEAKRRAVIAQLKRIQQQTGRTPTELERRTAAEAIGCLDHLPEPQDELHLPARRTDAAA